MKNRGNDPHLNLLLGKNTQLPAGTKGPDTKAGRDPDKKLRPGQ